MRSTPHAPFHVTRAVPRHTLFHPMPYSLPLFHVPTTMVALPACWERDPSSAATAKLVGGCMGGGTSAPSGFRPVPPSLSRSPQHHAPSQHIARTLQPSRAGFDRSCSLPGACHIGRVAVAPQHTRRPPILPAVSCALPSPPISCEIEVVFWVSQGQKHGGVTETQACGNKAPSACLRRRSSRSA